MPPNLGWGLSLASHRQHPLGVGRRPLDAFSLFPIVGEGNGLDAGFLFSGCDCGGEVQTLGKLVVHGCGAVCQSVDKVFRLAAIFLKSVQFGRPGSADACHPFAGDFAEAGWGKVLGSMKI